MIFEEMLIRPQSNEEHEENEENEENEPYVARKHVLSRLIS